MTFRDSLSIMLLKFIQIVGCITSSFLFHYWVLFYGVNVSVCLSGHQSREFLLLSSLRLLPTKLLWTTTYSVLCRYRFPFLWDKCQGVRCWDVWSAYLYFLRNWQTCPEWLPAIPISILPNVWLLLFYFIT